MRPVVVDASTLLKWVLPGSDEADVPQANAIAAAAIAGRLDLLVPDLMVLRGRQYSGAAGAGAGGCTPAPSKMV